MSWTVENSFPESPAISGWGSLLRLELRQLWWLYPAVLAAGIGVWILLLTVTQNVPTEARPEGVVFNYVGSLVLSIFPLLLAGSGLTSSKHGKRLQLWRSLPISRASINWLRLLSLFLPLGLALLTWPLILNLLATVYGPVPVWVIVFAALAAFDGLLLTLVSRLGAVAVFLGTTLPASLPFLFPATRDTVAAAARLIGGPWPVLSLALVGLVILWRIIRQNQD